MKRRNMPKWAFIVPSVQMSGGINVVFQHALYAIRHNARVTIVSKNSVKLRDIIWHPEAERLSFKTFEECADETFDCVIVTAWQTAYYAHLLKAYKYIYFVQSIESRFFDEENKEMAALAELSYTIPFKMITEATWIKDYLYEKYGHSAGLILNGIRKDLYLKNEKVVAPREKEKLRVLIEGSVTQWLKNIHQTVQLCKASEADEIWLLTSSGIDSYEGVDRVFSQVPVDKVPEIYRSCDVLVKLSLVEGMFGPPLEMFHCGGTAIVYSIPGSEEYVENEENALVIEVGDEAGVIEAINKLKNDEQLLEKLKNNALKTAYAWRDWETSSEEFFSIVINAPDMSEGDIKKIREQSEQGCLLYEAYDSCMGLKQPVSRITEIIQASEKLDIVIYGTGQVARGILYQLDKCGKSIVGVAVTKQENNPVTFFGHKVSIIQEFLEIKDRCLIVIATTRYHQEIYKSLLDMGFNHII